MSNTTTDLEILRKEPQRFTWGKIDEIIDVGESSGGKSKPRN